jgi:hypothetical protein
LSVFFALLFLLDDELVRAFFAALSTPPAASPLAPLLLPLATPAAPADDDEVSAAAPLASFLLRATAADAAASVVRLPPAALDELGRGALAALEAAEGGSGSGGGRFLMSAVLRGEKASGFLTSLTGLLSRISAAWAAARDTCASPLLDDTCSRGRLVDRKRPLLNSTHLQGKVLGRVSEPCVVGRDAVRTVEGAA